MNTDKLETFWYQTMYIETLDLTLTLSSSLQVKLSRIDFFSASPM